MEFNEVYRQRTKRLTVEVAKWYHGLPVKDTVIREFGRQLIRCTASTAANFRAACRARSPNEYFAKLCIVVEECDETLFWMECFEELDWLETKGLRKHYQEAEALIKVFAPLKRRAKEKLKNRGNRH